MGKPKILLESLWLHCDIHKILIRIAYGVISYIVIKDFNISRNPLNFMFSVLIMVLTSLNSISLI
jgi:hypothetical protein